MRYHLQKKKITLGHVIPHLRKEEKGREPWFACGANMHIWTVHT
jgi:hypothetical protein